MRIRQVLSLLASRSQQQQEGGGWGAKGEGERWRGGYGEQHTTKHLSRLVTLLNISLHFTYALSIHCKMWPSVSALHCCLSTAVIFRVVPTFCAM